MFAMPGMALGMIGGVTDCGDTTMVGAASAGLTPRLLISVEPSGMPVRLPPTGDSGDVDDAVGLLDPEPHAADNPEVSTIGEVVDWPDGSDVPDIAIELEAAIVAGAALPTDVPPPSKTAVEPNIVDGAAPMVEHPVLPAVPVSRGLNPGDAISVAPNGSPVPPTGGLGTMPSGDVTASEGVGVAAACAKTGLAINGSVTTAIIMRFIVLSLIRSSIRPRGDRAEP
jgi:hypothetical protein